MEHRQETRNVLWGLVILGILVGCGAQPRSTYPVLEEVVESDADLDCAGFDDDLLKANALRDAIFEEHGDVIRDAVLYSAVDILGNPVAGIFSGVIGAAILSKESKHYIEAAAAAGLRMEQLLVYKERDDCPSGPTGNPDLTDSIILAQLQDLGSQLDQQDITPKQYISERRKLLDGLR